MGLTFVSVDSEQSSPQLLLRPFLKEYELVSTRSLQAVSDNVVSLNLFSSNKYIIYLISSLGLRLLSICHIIRKVAGSSK